MENISVWVLVNHGASRLFVNLHHRNTLTYLLTYLIKSRHSTSAMLLLTVGNRAILVARLERTTNATLQFFQLVQ